MKFCTYFLSATLLMFLSPRSSGCSLPNETRNSEYFCARISHINEMPHKQGLTTEDKIYKGLIDNGLNSTPCLIEAVTDGTQIQDPRSSPGSSLTIAVGDLAFFIWWRITGASIEDILPPEVVEDYQKNGMFAYFTFIQVPGNRRVLQETLLSWHTNNKN